MKTDKGLLLLPTAQVLMVIAKGERLIITTAHHGAHSFLYRLKDLEARLDPAEFVRLSRSIIVNVNTVSCISPHPGGTSTVVLENGERVGMSRKQTGRLRRILQDVLG